MKERLGDLVGENIIDSRRLIKIQNELESEIKCLTEEAEERVVELHTIQGKIVTPGLDPGEVELLQSDAEGLEGIILDLETDLTDYRDEFKELEYTLDEIGDNARSGELLILDDYFEEYAQDFAYAIDAIPCDTTWPCDCIDWEQAARALKQDYRPVTIRGDDYWCRS